MLQCLSTHLCCSNETVWNVPDGWSMEAAASVPLAYITAYYALKIRANIRAKSSVLIHSATSCVGQACIQVAKQYGCSIFVTADSEQQKTTLVNKLGVLKDHVFNSDKCAQAIMRATDEFG